MANWTETDAANHMQKARAGWKDDAIDEKESVLQGKIVDWAQRHGYPCHSHPQTQHYVRAHTKGAGWSDVTLCIKDRVVFLELKSKKGVLKEAQIENELKMKYLGHEYYKIRTWREFERIVSK